MSHDAVPSVAAASGPGTMMLPGVTVDTFQAEHTIVRPHPAGTMHAQPKPGIGIANLADDLLTHESSTVMARSGNSDG